MSPLEEHGAIRVVAKQVDSDSTAPADKQINEQRYIQPPPSNK